MCSDNGDVLPEAAIPADRAKDMAGRTGPIGYLDDSATWWPGRGRGSDIMIHVGEQVVHKKTLSKSVDRRRLTMQG